MRFKSRSAFVALVAVLALGVAGSASAALPEFTVKSPTKFPVAFSGKSGAVTFTEPGGSTYNCSSSAVSGQITGSKEVGSVVIKFSGCGGLRPICWNYETASGLWETKELHGRIAYITKAKEARNSTVGLLLEPTTQPVATCGPVFEGVAEEEILGSMLGAISPLNQEITGPYSLGYGSWTHFEGEETTHKLQRVVEHGAPKALEMKDNLSLTMAHAVEIRA
jgi:hypothetical protein